MAEQKKTTAMVKKDSINHAIQNKTIADSVFKKITELEEAGGLDLPGTYSPANALKSAWLIFQDTPKLMACSDNSKANALLDMVIQGLSPSKSQCYFIPYGNEAKMQRSYLGNVAVTKRLEIVEDITAQAIYKGDEVTTEIKDGYMKISEHKHDWKNQNGEVIGAYATIHLTNGKVVSTIMTMEQIQKAWEQGSMKGKSGAHQNFTDEMSKKTVMNRACKLFLNTSDDSDLLVESVNRTRSLDDIPETEAEEILEKQIEENTATEEIDIEVAEVEEAEAEESIFDKGAREAKTGKRQPGF